MRIVELSNHPESELRKERARREDEDRARIAERDASIARLAVEYETTLRDRQREIAMLEREARRLRSNWRLLRALRTWRQLRRAINSPPPDPPAPPQGLPPQGATRLELTLAAGIEGERKAAAELASVLGDGWTWLRGYQNNRGEIDGLLLGSGGLFAIECKHRRGTAHCQRDDWWVQKFDRWGNPRERDRLVDGGGRSPSRQVNDIANELERFLERRRQPIKIPRIVLFTHPHAVSGTFDNPTVDLITTAVGDIVALIEIDPTALNPDRQAQLQKLIVNDHRFHAQRMRRGKGEPRVTTCGVVHR